MRYVIILEIRISEIRVLGRSFGFGDFLFWEGFGELVAFVSLCFFFVVFLLWFYGFVRLLLVMRSLLFRGSLLYLG